MLQLTTGENTGWLGREGGYWSDRFSSFLEM